MRRIALLTLAAFLGAGTVALLLSVSEILGAAFTLHADCTATTGAIISAGKFNNCMTGIQTGINAIDDSRVATGAGIVGSKLNLTSGTGRILMSPAAFSGVPSTTGSVFNAAAVTFTDNDTAASGTATAFAAYALQRPTLTAGNTSVTTTDAATWYIANSPAAGTNETLTNPWALWVDAGNVRFDDNIYWRSGTSFNGIFDHAITAARTWTFPDVTGTVLLLEGAQTISGVKTFGANLLFTDNTYDIGASGATRPRTGYFGTSVVTTTLTGTLSTAAQTNVTSLGTLTSLTVDDITINGNTISSAGASTLAITPTAGQAITFDGTVTLDAGVIAGATSITSTTFSVTGATFDGAFTSAAGDNGANMGRNISLGRNSNASTPAAGHVKMVDASGNVWAVWPDDTGVLRILEGNPTNANDTAGTIVGAQTSWHEAKDVLGPTQVSPATALATLIALPIYDFRYKQPSLLGPLGESPVFTGVVGYQRSDWFLMNVGPGQNPALNEVALFGYTVQAIKELERRIGALEAKSL